MREYDGLQNSALYDWFDRTNGLILKEGKNWLTCRFKISIIRNLYIIPLLKEHNKPVFEMPSSFEIVKIYYTQLVFP